MKRYKTAIFLNIILMILLSCIRMVFTDDFYTRLGILIGSILLIPLTLIIVYIYSKFKNEDK